MTYRGKTQCSVAQMTDGVTGGSKLLQVELRNRCHILFVQCKGAAAERRSVETSLYQCQYSHQNWHADNKVNFYFVRFSIAARPTKRPSL